MKLSRPCRSTSTLRVLKSKSWSASFSHIIELFLFDILEFLVVRVYNLLVATRTEKKMLIWHSELNVVFVVLGLR